MSLLVICPSSMRFGGPRNLRHLRDPWHVRDRRQVRGGTTRSAVTSRSVGVPQRARASAVGGDSAVAVDVELEPAGRPRRDLGDLLEGRRSLGGDNHQGPGGRGAGGGGQFAIGMRQAPVGEGGPPAQEGRRARRGRSWRSRSRRRREARAVAAAGAPRRPGLAAYSAENGPTPFGLDPALDP